MEEKEKSRFIHAKEVAKILQVSNTTAYRIIKQLNEELVKQGKIIIPGKISRRYFEEKTYM